jgi:aminopeptidase N
LRKFAAQWLETAQVNTLRAELSIAGDGTYSSVAVRQDAPASHPVLRTHRVAIGCYDLRENRLVLRDRIELDVDGEHTEVPALAGRPAADVLLLNDLDLTYAKLRLDDRSMRCVVDHIAGFDNPLARGLCWAAAWDMVRDGELATREYIRLVTSGLHAEGDINLVTSTLRQAQTALAFYADPGWAPEGTRQMARAAERALAEAQPGGGFQIAWLRAFASFARDAADLATLGDWLAGRNVPNGLRFEADLRWGAVHALVACGAAGPDLVDAELAADRTASGERQAALSRALVPTAASKAETWRRLSTDHTLPNWFQRAMLQGFQHSAQVELTAPVATEYFTVIDQVWAERDSEQAQDFVQLAFPAYQVDQKTVALTDQWLAQPGHPAPLRRLVAEGRDGVLRALRARRRDTASVG